MISDDDVIKWKYFPRYWPYVRGIHGSPVYSTYKGQCRGSCDVFFDLRLDKRLRKNIEKPVIWDAIALIMTLV